ncbi:RNA-binding S4 domain-containing protein [Xanthomonas sp. NCPPB 1325]|uniref:RNA-binding S4 domain-containing protein n=1 Tax=Xanthomonas sp. NCPPB 1325 TaxID=487529 RepID=UPI0035571BC5
MQFLEFYLDGEYIELNQLLKLAGIADSGGQGKAIVASGAVSVDGVQELRKTAKIRPGQLVQLEEVEIRVLAMDPDADRPA